MSFNHSFIISFYFIHLAHSLSVFVLTGPKVWNNITVKRCCHEGYRVAQSKLVILPWKYFVAPVIIGYFAVRILYGRILVCRDS